MFQNGIPVFLDFPIRQWIFEDALKTLIVEIILEAVAVDIDGLDIAV